MTSTGIEKRRCRQGRCCAHGDEVRVIEAVEIYLAQTEPKLIYLTDVQGYVQEFIVNGEITVRSK